MEKILVALSIIFAVFFSSGLSFLEYGMFNPTISLILTVIGILGLIITILILYKLGALDKKRENEQLEVLKKVVDSNKLKDDGTDIDKVIKVVREKDIKYDNLK